MLNEPEKLDSPLRYVAAFERSPNYPRDAAGVQFLAQGLAKAATRWGVPMAEIVQRCLEFSPRCPTDADLLTIAGSIQDDLERAAQAKRSRIAEWEAECGPPQRYDWRAEVAKIEEGARAYWAKDRLMIKLMKDICVQRGVKIHLLGHPQSFRLQVWAQEQVGLPVTPDQQLELRHIGGQDIWWLPRSGFPGAYRPTPSPSTANTISSPEGQAA